MRRSSRVGRNQAPASGHTQWLRSQQVAAAHKAAARAARLGARAQRLRPRLRPACVHSARDEPPSSGSAGELVCVLRRPRQLSRVCARWQLLLRPTEAGGVAAMVSGYDGPAGLCSADCAALGGAFCCGSSGAPESSHSCTKTAPSARSNAKRRRQNTCCCRWPTSAGRAFVLRALPQICRPLANQNQTDDDKSDNELTLNTKLLASASIVCARRAARRCAPGADRAGQIGAATKCGRCISRPKGTLY